MAQRTRAPVFLSSLLAALVLAAPSITAGSPTGGARPVDVGARVTEIRINKGEHTLKLVAGSDVLRTYKVAIGSGGAGPKQFEGDRKTPVGVYRLSGRIKGLFHQFLMVSYPNQDDRVRFAELSRLGRVPSGRGVGHSIGIHGVGDGAYAGVHKEVDWTFGCIALDDDEIDEVARFAPDGTRIVITD